MTVLNMPTDKRNSLGEQMQNLGKQARTAYQALANATTQQKNNALTTAATMLRKETEALLSANAKDMKAGKEKGLTDAQLDRLKLTAERVEGMAQGLEAIAQLPDPVGKELAEVNRPNGLTIKRVATPLGVIGIIYESRPNVTVDAGALCLKSGNAVILRGGSESIHSSTALVKILQAALKEAGLPELAVQTIPTTDREAVGMMLRMSDMIDVIVPRGGKSLTARVQNESRVPTLLHLDGNCHIYLHAKADATKAKDVLVNAKLRRTGICGATESVLVDESVAKTLLPDIIATLQEKGCEVRGDATVQSIADGVIAADEEDWGTEYLDAILSVKVVKDVDEAVEHINRYGSHHTDSIITEDADVAKRFLKGVDSAIVMHNASTQFADGGEFGMGAEIGIATGRLHARGPVGLEQLVTYKYNVLGDGQTRP